MSSEQPLLPVIEDEIRDAIRARGRISFYRFMELCLYHPQCGYYNSEKVRLGKGGDFYTSAHTAPVFGRILARHLERSWRELGKPSYFELVELGPGDGLLASELLSWIGERFPEMLSCLHYIGVEQSAPLRSRLKEVLRPFGERARVVADWEAVSATPARQEGFQAIRAATVREREPVSANPDERYWFQSIQRCVLANEFFDALPFHLLVWRDGEWKERYVCLEAQRLSWCEGEPSSSDLAQQADSRFAPALPLPEREEGWVAEVSPLAGEWIRRISQLHHHLPQQGEVPIEVLVIDYGYTLDEWQQGRFPQGSAMAYRRHQVLDDLLSCPGDQDITAHVNFSQLMEAGRKAGMRVRRFESQSRFLMELGEGDEFRDIFADCGSEAERLRRSQLLKTLVLPQGMGETFRVLVLEKAL